MQSEAAMGAPPFVIAVLQSATHDRDGEARQTVSTSALEQKWSRSLTALISELHAGKREVRSEARFRASLDGEVARDVDASREHALVDRVTAGERNLQR